LDRSRTQNTGKAQIVPLVSRSITRGNKKMRSEGRGERIVKISLGRNLVKRKGEKKHEEQSDQSSGEI